MEEKLLFPWSDNWYVEGDKAYFCATEISALFCVNMNSWICELIDYIPESNIRVFRTYSYCFKNDSIVFCLPNRGTDIWCFDLEKKEWNKIRINNKNRIMGCLFTYTQYKNQIWLREELSGRVIEVNLLDKQVEKEYYIPQSGNIFMGRYTLVQDIIFLISGNKIYSIYDDKINVYELPEVKAQLYTVCYDGSDFWLSGFSKEIYIWNPEKGIVNVLTEFPEQFGLYNYDESNSALVDKDSFLSNESPFFSESIVLGEDIWFFPFQSNEILYIDRKNHKINILEIEGEQETRESLNRAFSIKYIVEYIREERYIGVYSIKNLKIFEIDTVEKSIIYKQYRLSDDALSKLAMKYRVGRIFNEIDKFDNCIYSVLLNSDIKFSKNVVLNNGKIIYDYIL